MRIAALILSAFMLFTGGTHIQAQTNTSKKTVSKYPDSFAISKADFDNLFNTKPNTVLKTPANKYLDKSVLELSTHTGDMHLLRIKLSYFPKATLMVQVNGEYSTQVYITSNDKALSYKGKVEKDKVTLTKCNRDEIVSE